MEKALNKLNEKELIKMATEKAWKDYRDEVESKARLKEILKKVLKKEKIGFIYTWRINDVRDYGTMYGDNYKVYESVLRNLNYIENYSHWDSKFTKEVDSVFVWDKDYYRSNLQLLNYIFNTNFDRELYTEGDNFIYRQDIRDREAGKPFLLTDKIRNFLKKSGYTIYKSWNNLGNNFRLPSFNVF